MNSFSYSELRPFVAAVLLQGPKRGASGRVLADALLKEIRLAVTNSATSTRKIVDTSVASTHGSLQIVRLVYSQTGVPSWLATDIVQDVVHHLALVAVCGQKAALLVSDSVMRDAMLSSITMAVPLGREIVSAAFVGSDAKTVWLNGVHARTTVKPDSKTLTGLALEHALDPLGDQSYVLSAIRSQPPVSGLRKGKRAVVVGAAPGSSRVWLGRPGTWNGFVSQLEALFNHLGGRITASNLYDFLSQAITDVSAVRDAYGIAVLPRDLLEEDASVSGPEREEANRWAYDASYTVTGSGGLDLKVAVEIGGAQLGSVEIAVRVSPDGKASLEGTWPQPDPAVSEQRKTFTAFLTGGKQVKVYYDSGHAITDGRCFVAGWTDQILNWQFESFAGYRVDREKPTIKTGQKLADYIGGTGDKSLFAFIQQKLFVKGWLACDDGAMELADFVHLDPDTEKVTLIHAKAAGSRKVGRQVSVADYELVVSQGVKNIRHLDRDRLAEALERGKTKDIARAVWKDGCPQGDRAGMIAAIRRLPQIATRQLLILQPRLTKKEHTYCASGKVSDQRVRRFKQLNALMLAARISVMGIGAEFNAIAAS